MLALYLISGLFYEDGIKTNIMIDYGLWEDFKSKVGNRRAIEEAIEDEISDILIIKALEKLLRRKKEILLVISPVKPKVSTDAGKIVGELRESRL